MVRAAWAATGRPGAARRRGVRKFAAIGRVCAYLKHARIPSCPRAHLASRMLLGLSCRIFGIR